jgi:hypothetical protein
MALYYQTRNWWATSRAVEGLVKVCCFGDSTMYGLGVLPDEALPSRLERQLNETHGSTLFVVENHGVPGSNLWEVWGDLREYLVAASCDLIVVSLCNNDAGLFEKILGRTTYPNAVYETFEERNAYWRGMNAALRGVLESIRAVTRQPPVPVIVLWIGHRDSDLPLVEQVNELCREVGLPFIDSVTVLRSLFGPDADAELTVSRIDVHHLNARALDVTARHLALAVREGGWIQTQSVDQPFEGLADRITEISGRMSDAGCPSISPFRWALNTVAAKQRVAARFASGQALETARRELATASSRWRRDYATHLHFLSSRASIECCGVDLDLLHESVNHLTAVDELTCGAALREPSSVDEQLSRRFAELRPGLDPGDVGYFGKTLQEGLEQLAHAEHRAARGRESDELPDADKVSRALARARHAAGRLLCLPFAESSPARQAAAVLAVERFHIATAQLCDVGVSGVEDSTPDYSTAPFHSTIDLHVEYPRIEKQKLIFIYVTIDYHTPAFPPVRDFHWIESTDRPRVYRLHFPLLLRGRLTLNLEAMDHCYEGLEIVKRIEVSNSPRNKRVLWQPRWGRGLMSAVLVRNVVMA